MVVLRWKADGDYLKGLNAEGLARWTRNARVAMSFRTKTTAEKWLRRRVGSGYRTVRSAFRVVERAARGQV